MDVFSNKKLCKANTGRELLHLNMNRWEKTHSSALIAVAVSVISQALLLVFVGNNDRQRANKNRDSETRRTCIIT